MAGGTARVLQGNSTSSVYTKLGAFEVTKAH